MHTWKKIIVPQGGYQLVKKTLLPSELEGMAFSVTVFQEHNNIIIPPRSM